MKTSGAFRLPAGPRLAPVALASYLYDPYAFMSRGFAKYGDPFTTFGPEGKVVMTARPQEAKKIFAIKPNDLVAHFGTVAIKSIAGPRTVPTMDGQRHLEERKILMPPLHGRQIRPYAEAIARATRLIAERWREGEIIDLRAQMEIIALDVSVRVLFGFTDDGEVQNFSERLLRMMRAAKAASAMLFFPRLQRDLRGTGLWARFVRARAEVDRIVGEQIVRRRSDVGQGNDVLSSLLVATYEGGGAMANEDIRDELIALLMAAFETTAISSTWSVMLLHRHPENLALALEEVQGASQEADLATLPFLNAAIKESLRLYPPITDVARTLRRPYEIAGWALPPMTGVGVCVYMLHRNRDVYPDPETFRPERFWQRDYAPHEYAPFGGGVRRCLGAALATFQMPIILGVSLRSHEFELVRRFRSGVTRSSIAVGPSSRLLRICRRRARTSLARKSGPS